VAATLALDTFVQKYGANGVGAGGLLLVLALMPETRDTRSHVGR
jgi:hypothetical protein